MCTHVSYRQWTSYCIERKNKFVKEHVRYMCGSGNPKRTRVMPLVAVRIVVLFSSLNPIFVTLGLLCACSKLTYTYLTTAHRHILISSTNAKCYYTKGKNETKQSSFYLFIYLFFI